MMLWLCRLDWALVVHPRRVLPAYCCVQLKLTLTRREKGTDAAGTCSLHPGEYPAYEVTYEGKVGMCLADVVRRA
jgi:hypothetical protein